jgi:hypothetical protein
MSAGAAATPRTPTTRTASTRTASTRTASTRTASTRTASTRTAPARTASTRTASTRTAPTRSAARTGAPTGTRSTPRATPVRPELRLVPGAPVVRSRRQAPRALRHPRAAFVLLVVALLAATTLGLLVLNTAIAVDSLEATELRTQNAERAQEIQRLQQQVVTAGTPAEVARAAVAAGLVPAGPAAYLVIDPDGGSVLRGAPEPAPAPGEDGD